ncbi:MAG: hypothetical protein ACYDBH_10990 [Acidobacteriaceae bacterium]
MRRYLITTLDLHDNVHRFRRILTAKSAAEALRIVGPSAPGEYLGIADITYPGVAAARARQNGDDQIALMIDAIVEHKQEIQPRWLIMQSRAVDGMFGVRGPCEAVCVVECPTPGEALAHAALEFPEPKDDDAFRIIIDLSIPPLALHLAIEGGNNDITSAILAACPDLESQRWLITQIEPGSTERGIFACRTRTHQEAMSEAERVAGPCPHGATRNATNITDCRAAIQRAQNRGNSSLANAIKRVTVGA